MVKIKKVLESVKDELFKSKYRDFDVYVAKNLNNDLMELIIKPNKRQK
jgi:hypothetical protein